MKVSNLFFIIDEWRHNSQEENLHVRKTAGSDDIYFRICVEVWHKRVTKHKSVLNCENNMVKIFLCASTVSLSVKRQHIDRVSERETSAHSEGIDRQIKNV